MLAALLLLAASGLPRTLDLLASAAKKPAALAK